VRGERAGGSDAVMESEGGVFCSSDWVGVGGV
jgi:hypothetical protein